MPIKAAPWILILLLSALSLVECSRRAEAETTASTLADIVAAQSADIESLTKANAAFEDLARQAADIAKQAIAEGERVQAHAAELAAAATARQRAADAARRAFEQRAADPDCKALLDLPVCPALQEM